MSQSMHRAASLPVDKAASLQTIDTTGNFWSMLGTKGHLVVWIASAPQTQTMTMPMNGSRTYSN